MALGGPAARADGSPPASVDVAVRLDQLHPQVAPGSTLDIFVEAAKADGSSTDLNSLTVLLHLPKGLSLVPEKAPDGTEPLCTAVSTAPGDVRCHGYQGRLVSTNVRLHAAADVPSGTRLTVTATADLGGAVDPNPSNNTATLDVLVKPGADFTAHWIAPPQPMRPGPATTRLVVTNKGQDTDSFMVGFSVADISRPAPWLTTATMPKSCGWGDDTVVCNLQQQPLAPGHSITLSFPYRVAESGRGKSLTLKADVAPGNPSSEANPADNQASVTLTVARGAGSSPSASATPGAGATAGATAPSSAPPSVPATPAATPSPSSSTALATTGGGTDSGPMALVGVGSVLVGGGIVALARRRRGPRRV